MKKLISLSVFVMIIVLSLVARSSHAQGNPSVVVVKPGCSTPGYWKWNRRMHARIWISAPAKRRAHWRQGFRVRYW